MSDLSSPEGRQTVLIVDDDQLMRQTFQDLLQEAGFATSLAEDGDAAIDAFRRLQPDLVLLDLLMPGKDGFDTCRELRATPGGEYTPVLMITGLGDPESIHRAFESGATDFISKPVNRDLFLYRVRYMLRAGLSTKRLAKSEARLANAQRIARLGNCEWDCGSRTLWGSEETFRMLGVERRGEFLSIEELLCVVYPPDRETVEKSLADACEKKQPFRFEFRVIDPDGRLRILCMQGEMTEDAPGMAPHMEGTLQDITEMRHVEERLVMLKEAVDCLPLGITISDVNNRIVYTNPAEARMHGYAIDDLVDRDVRLFPGLNLDKAVTREWEEGDGVWRREGTNIRRDGDELPVQLSSIAVKNAEERCLGMVTVCEDITSRKKAEERIQLLAYYDILTGLPNRSAFMDRLQHSISMAQRDGHRIALLFLDLDNFKDINDTQGHDFGDRLIREVAKRLVACMRDSDSLARLGGDEFVMVLNGVSDQEGAAIAARRFLSAFSRPFNLECRQIYTSASIGIALFPDDGEAPDILFKCADTAMYHAKAEGKSNFRFFSAEMNRRIMRRVALEGSLRRGIENGEFFLHYQPQWDLRETRILGVEALLRWRSSEMGVLHPAEFIPLAENSGQIIVLGEWAMRAACLQAREWEEAGFTGLKMAVNISGMQFRQPDFLHMVANVIKETGVSADYLELEFTESVVMDQADKTIDTLRALKEMGVSLSIDDFGTGYSSLSYLKHFPIDRIKIDRSFVADISRSSDDAAIVEAIISMAHSLNLRVVAEGVETGEQLNFLRKRNCDEVQGFHLAVPMPAEELVGRMDRSNGAQGGWIPVIPC